MLQLCELYQVDEEHRLRLAELVAEEKERVHSDYLSRTAEAGLIDLYGQAVLPVADKISTLGGHAFLSYVREDSHIVNQLQKMLEDARIPVWRDTVDLWPGQDWRRKIQEAINVNALVFIACFSHNSVARVRTYQNEELALAVEQLRQRHPDDPWLIPVRFDDCKIPDLYIGPGRTLASIQRVDLFGRYRRGGEERLVASVRRLLAANRHGL